MSTSLLGARALHQQHSRTSRKWCNQQPQATYGTTTTTRPLIRRTGLAPWQMSRASIDKSRLTREHTKCGLFGKKKIIIKRNTMSKWPGHSSGFYFSKFYQWNKLFIYQANSDKLLKNKHHKKLLKVKENPILKHTSSLYITKQFKRIIIHNGLSGYHSLYGSLKKNEIQLLVFWGLSISKTF